MGDCPVGVSGTRRLIMGEARGFSIGDNTLSADLPSARFFRSAFPAGGGELLTDARNDLSGGGEDITSVNLLSSEVPPFAQSDGANCLANAACPLRAAVELME